MISNLIRLALYIDMPHHFSTNYHTKLLYLLSGYSISDTDHIRSPSGEIFIPVKSYDNTFDDFHMNRWLEDRDRFGSIAAPELDMHRVDWENGLRGKKSDMFKFSPHSDFGTSTIESSRTVSKVCLLI